MGLACVGPCLLDPALANAESVKLRLHIMLLPKVADVSAGPLSDHKVTWQERQGSRQGQLVRHTWAGVNSALFFL